MRVPADEVDSQRFERMVARSRELLELGEPERAAYLLAQALGLWRGRAFEDVESWDLAAIEAGRLDELRLEAEELRVDASLRTGRHLDVLAVAESMVKAAPLRERRWTLLALAQYQSGRQTEALRTIHRLKSLLAEQAGPRPGAGTGIPRRGDPAAGRLAAGPRFDTAEPHLPVSRSDAVRRRRLRVILRPRRRRACLPGTAQDPQRACRWWGRQVAASRLWCGRGSLRRCAETAARRHHHSRRAPDAVARGRGRPGTSVGAPGRPVRGGILALHRRGREGRLLRCARPAGRARAAGPGHAGGPAGRGLGLSRASRECSSAACICWGR